jgi:hypothetical protein
MPCSGILGYEKPCSGVALCMVLSPPQFGQETFAAQSPITCPNRQLPGTLGDIFFEIYREFWLRIIKMGRNIDKIGLDFIENMR